jgi:hypothetical protein
MLNYQCRVREVSCILMVVISTQSIEEVLQLFLLKENYDYFDILEFIIK